MRDTTKMLFDKNYFPKLQFHSRSLLFYMIIVVQEALTDSIKLSLQDLQICFGLSIGVPFPVSALFVPCGDCKMSLRTINQGCYISDP